MFGILNVLKKPVKCLLINISHVAKKIFIGFKTNMQDISFHGNFVKSTYIKKLCKDGVYRPYKVNLVELGCDDFVACSEVAEKWNEGSSFIIAKSCQFLDTSTYLKKSSLRKAVNMKYLDKEDIDYLKQLSSGVHIYALTTQKKGFKQLDSDSILGLVEFVSRKKSNEVTHIQTRPDCISKKKDKKYLEFIKNFIKKILGVCKVEEKCPFIDVGKMLIKCLQNMYDDKKMTVISLDHTRGFYKKMGFSVNNYGQNEYVWYPSCVKK